MSNRAWVTLATNDSYGLGALVVAHSLRRSGSVYPAVVLITPSVTDAMRERLRAVFAEVVVVDVLDSKDAAHLALLQRPELGITFTKIHCWNLTQYEKCVFLDADTLIVQNCDELFEREELSAAPDVGWPDCFNSGVFVFTPSAETFNNLIKFASERGSFDGGDQGLLNSYFSDWAQGDINKHLPFLYNVTSAAFYSYIPALKHYGQNLKIIHFIGAAKPWLQQFNWQTRSVDAPEHLREFLQLWWDLFVGQVHSQLDTAMGEVEEELLAILQEETVDFNNPTVEFSYYEPTLDSDSEFPWHHPENQVADPEINVPEINMSEFHNPWDIYVGNIPASKEDFNQNEKKADYYQEIRRHAWDYIHPDQTECHNYQTTFNSSDNYTSEHKEEVWQSNFESSPNNNQTHLHLHVPLNDHYYQQHETYPQSQDHTNIPQHISEPLHMHNNHYNDFSRPDDNNKIINQSYNKESQPDGHVCYTHSLLDHDLNVGKKLKNFSSQIHKQNRPQIYSVMMDHVRVKHHEPEEKLNGYASGADIDLYEEITPRHPYDGFYMRHRMTIDPRGRKICSHEIPFRPPSPLSDSSEEFEDAMEAFAEEITNKALNGEDSQTGVAGNLARVVPGAPLQQEAVDELARRQGWEAGNIDYMGADSFDNIWAKISQTLSQPPNSEHPEPPKEEAQPVAMADPPSASALVDTVSEPAPVAVQAVDVPKQEEEASKEKKVDVIPSEAVPVEVPAPVESETVENTSEAEAVAPAEVAAVVEPIPVEVPVPADEAPTPASDTTEAPGKPEEIIPVPVEAAAVELAESAPAEVSGEAEPDATEIPVVALEALKIDEAPSAAVGEATKEQVAPAPTPSVPESPLTPSQETTPIEPVEELEATSDSPPLANTPSKEEIPGAPAAKSTEEAAQETRL
ncbi:uncharacterized protein LOC120632017 isoform X3 [Pararge aegeria]|nr:uncharacterized protein LOC120632017 isoform X3 [Pararge aegeria]XP_039757728.1 uncharacterized protein LOC120632017 isoform X3 [Pararge aegeria]